MLDKKPHELEFPFHVVVTEKQLAEIDTTFSYHVLLAEKEISVDIDENDEPIKEYHNVAYAMCNDIPCQICPFSCKEGKDRNKILSEYAKKHFPEMVI